MLLWILGAVAVKSLEVVAVVYVVRKIRKRRKNRKEQEMKKGKDGFTVVEMGCVLLLLVVGVMIYLARTSRYQKDIPAEAINTATIDNPIAERPVIHSDPQQQQQPKIGWAVASNTSSGVLIEASVKVKY